MFVTLQRKELLKPMENKEALNTLHEIKELMEKSSRFQAISGWSILIVGLLASMVSAGAWLLLLPHEFTYPATIVAPLSRGDMGMLINSPYRTVIASGVALALLVVSFAVVCFGSYRLMKRQGDFQFGRTIRRPLFHFAVPMVVGGLLCLAMLMQGHYGLTSTFMLVFYGLALLNASHYTSRSIALLGYCELVLGVVDCFMVSHAILFWFLGFGLLHIVFGIYFIVNGRGK
jgi:hypothetical protein